MEGRIGEREPVTDTPDTFTSVPVAQRRQSVAHFLSLILDSPLVVENEGAYREAMWSASSFRSDTHQRVAGQWAGLIAKYVWQDALCSIWSEFCKAGFEAMSADGKALSWDQVRAIASNMTEGDPSLVGEEPIQELVERISSGDVRLPGLEGPVYEVQLEELRSATDRIDSATSGLIVILELHRRSSDRTDSGWLDATQIGSAWQPPLVAVLQNITAHLATRPTVADMLWWIVQHYVLEVHQRIAYSKLPEYTFRFRWEEGRLRFYNNGLGRFQLAAIRREPLTQLTWDLAFWEQDATSDARNGNAGLTERGRRFVQEWLQ